MTVFTPTKASGSHFYRYQSAERLDRLKPIILEHLLYVPSVGQLNDPTDCRPKIRSMSEEEMVTFLRNDYIRRNPVLALDLLKKHESTIRTSIQIHGIEWFQRELSKILSAQMEQFRVYSPSKRFDNLSLWAKYAADHTGYCLEFANEGPLFGEHVMEVVYGEYEPFDVNDSKNRSAAFLVSKRPEWSNEEEVRLIRARGAARRVSIDPRWFTRIILGKNMSPANQKQIREWAKERDPELLVVNAYFDELHQEIRLKE
ncbi:MAG TPA: DUF2971 domain-containing protein [Candidatus Acidoferrum sp.]|nr:DUF2971 domain-containing protein [Candidatus Acidoferrum sp.]